MPDTKTVNYSDEQTVELVNAYTAVGTDEARKVVVTSYAEKFGKTTRSVIAKLSREKVYVKTERVTKAGVKIVKKDTLADLIGNSLHLSEGDTDSLAKANKSALVAILKALD